MSAVWSGMAALEAIIAEGIAAAEFERRAIDADPGPEEPRSCLQCGDSGEIHWNPSHIGDPQLEQSAPCPRCDGSATEPGTGAST
jgi:hypothetical protein